MHFIRALILDFDGVLVESDDEKMLAYDDLFSLYPSYSSEMTKYHITNYTCSRMTKFEYYVFQLMNCPGNVDLVHQMAAQFSEFVVRRVVACREVPGASEFLNEFSKWIPLYVSSLTPDDELRRILSERKISSYFIDIFGNPPWNKSEAIELILKRERLPSSEIALIGNSISDYLAANEAGLTFIGRNSGLLFPGAEVNLFNDLFEIADYIRPLVLDAS